MPKNKQMKLGRKNIAQQPSETFYLGHFETRDLLHLHLFKEISGRDTHLAFPCSYSNFVSFGIGSLLRNSNTGGCH